MFKCMKLLIAAFILFLALPRNIQAQGYRYDKEKTGKMLQAPSDPMGFATALPQAYSLKKWAPSTATQEGNSCVGWALAYAAMSITFNKALNITDKRLKDILAFDPVFTYAIAREVGAPNCDSSIYFPDAISQMLKYGCKRMIMPPLFLDCDESVFQYTDRFSAPFVPNEIYALDLTKGANNAERIKMIKTFIASGIPLPFGLNAPRSLLGDGLGNPLPTGLWKPGDNEELLGGHAMCVVGYSDTRFGGAFEIMNSWGSDFGEDGYFWIKYSDFISQVAELIYIEPVTVRTDQCKIGDCNNSYSCIKLSDGSSYEGMMENGKPEGYGVYMWADKDFYAGGWKEGKQEGRALFFTGEQIFKCVYSDGEMLTSEPLGFAGGSTAKPDDKMTIHLRKIGCDVQDKMTDEVIRKVESHELTTQWK